MNYEKPIGFETAESLAMYLKAPEGHRMNPLLLEAITDWNPAMLFVVDPKIGRLRTISDSSGNDRYTDGYITALGGALRERNGLPNVEDLDALKAHFKFYDSLKTALKTEFSVHERRTFAGVCPLTSNYISEFSSQLRTRDTDQCFEATSYESGAYRAQQIVVYAYRGNP